MRNPGSSMLILALLILAGVALAGAIAALRGKSLPAPSASVLLITASALRTLQILNDGSASVADANVLGALFLAAALLYYGPTRYWWLFLMPLAVAASFSPLIWLEFYKGAKSAVLMNAITVPACSFIAGSLLIVLRELRARSIANLTTMAVLRLRGENTMRALHSMETDLKTLRSLLSGETPAEIAPLQTTDFNAPVLRVSTEPIEACSVDEIDAAARRLLDEARALVAGRPVKLTLTAPVGSNLPIAVRGSVSAIASWMKSAVLNSVDSLGGFPDGAVRVTVRPGLTALQILVEDNGRGFSESILSKMGQASDRVSMAEIRAGVEQLGGRFEIQARLGVGSRLLMELPRIDAFAKSPRVARGVTSTAPSTEAQLH